MAYTAHGNVTVAGWRDYDFIQFLYTNTNTYQSEAINTARLIAQSPVVNPMGRNVQWTFTIDATDDDVIAISTSSGNAVPAPSATSTITVIGWNAGTVVGGGGGDGTDQTARDAAAAAQADADANTTAATAHAADSNAHHIPPTGGGGFDPLSIGSVNVAVDEAVHWYATGIPIPATGNWAIIRIGGEFQGASSWLYLPELRDSITPGTVGEGVGSGETMGIGVVSVGGTAGVAYIGKTTATGGFFLFGSTTDHRDPMPLQVFIP